MPDEKVTLPNLPNLPKPPDLARPPKATHETIGLLIAIYLLVLTTVLVGGAGVLWARSARPAKAEAPMCWRIQEAAGRVFKLNACTGETVEIIQERPAHTGVGSGARATTS